MEYDNLIANDPRVKSLANIEDRKATAGFILREKRGRINTLKDRLANLDGVGRVVAFRNRELASTMTAIRDQRRLMQTELSTGAFYGDERVPKSQRPPREGPGMGLDDGDISVEDLEALLSDAPTPESQTTEPEVVVSTPESEIPQIPQAEPSTSAPATEVVEAKAPPAAPPASDEDAMQQFLDAPDEPLPQALVEEPKHELESSGTVTDEGLSDVDAFINLLDGL
jgi:hypothetical protein